MTRSARNWLAGDLVATPVVRLAAFAVLLAVLAGGAALVGRASGLAVEESDDHNTPMGTAHGSEARAASGGNGLSDVAAGLRLRLKPTTLEAGRRSRLTLSIVDRHGVPVGSLDTEHGEPPLHLILVRRDLSGYQHLHPQRSGGRYVVDLALPLPGTWRAYVDVEIDGEKIVLGHDLSVPGDFVPQPRPQIADVERTGAYDVQLGRQELRADTGTTLRFEISRGRELVDALQPYLGAAGHLVAIREDDLAYLHVHPLESLATGGVEFRAELDEPGRYALFLEFKHEDRVHTAPFTVDVAR